MNAVRWAGSATARAAASLLIAIPLVLQTGHVGAAEPATLEKFFDDVVFAGKADGQIVKWTRPPVIRLDVREQGADGATAVRIPTPPDWQAALQKQVDALAELTGLAMHLAPPESDSGGDIVITIVPRLLMKTLEYPGVPEKLLQQQMGPSRCFFLIWPNPDRSIARAKIVINKNLEDSHIKHCFAEELTQAMGLPYDSDRTGPSIFNERLMLGALSPIDRLFVRTLYDPKLPPGARARDVQPVIAQLLQAGAKQHLVR